MEKHFVEEFLLKSYSGGKVAGFVEFDKGIYKSFFLFFVREQFDLEGFKHYIDIITQYINVSQFLSTLKDGASLRKKVVSILAMSR